MRIQCQIDEWAASVIADPITKMHVDFKKFPSLNGIPDARVFLPNTAGFADWSNGQEEFERWESQSEGYQNELQAYRNEIIWDRDIYSKINLIDPILDVGGHIGTIREFLPSKVRFLSVDPYIKATFEIPSSKFEAYSCLKMPLNFISGMAEFLPITSNSIGTVHMRSMLDHVQIPDLALIEANRVLRVGGLLVVGMSIEGAPYGESYSKLQIFKFKLAAVLGKLGIKRYSVSHDHHTWHPTLSNLRKLIEDNGFQIQHQIWQEKWQGRVVFIVAQKLS